MKTINDFISDEEILKIAKKCIECKTIPVSGRGLGKTTLQTRILIAMLYLQKQGNTNDDFKV